MEFVFTPHSRGVFRGGGVWGRVPTLDFHNIKRKNTVTHHSNRKKDKGGRKKKKYIVSGVMMAKETPPLPS